jgi:hypothetical protein
MRTAARTKRRTDRPNRKRVARAQRPHRSSRSSILSAFCDESLAASHCLFNRQPRRLEIAVTPTNETPATQINRQLSGTLRITYHNSPIRNKTPSNRQWQILEFTVTCRKQTSAPRSNRHFFRVVNVTNRAIRVSGLSAPTDSNAGRRSASPAHSISNRNNAAFKIRRNSMKINSEPNSNRNTNQGIAAVAVGESICNNADAASSGITSEQRERGICFQYRRGIP